MKRSTQIALGSFLFCFFSIQFYLTIFGGFFWPFSSHRLFSQLPEMKKPIIQAVLEDAEGNIYTVHPGKVIPIEYSRCSGLVRNLYRNGNKEKKTLFVNYLLKRLNEKPWHAFDETYSPIKSLPAAPFKKLSFETQVVEFKDRTPPELLDKITLFP